MHAVLEGRDSLVVLPTGGGKSLCFQAPALVAPEGGPAKAGLYDLPVEHAGPAKAGHYDVHVANLGDDNRSVRLQPDRDGPPEGGPYVRSLSTCSAITSRWISDVPS